MQNLRDQQAGFQNDRSCTDQIATLRIIVEQSLELNSSLYINFVDLQKAFDSLDHNSLWALMRHYGIPEKLITIIQKSYQPSTCQVVHNGFLSEPFSVDTGVRQGCLLSPLLFLMVVDWIMHKTTEIHNLALQWTPWSQLNDLDFADDIALVSHNHQQMQQKTTHMANTSAKIGLNVSKDKTKVMRINNTIDDGILLDGDYLEEVESFTYLGSVIAKDGGADKDIKARIGKARSAFLTLKAVWRSKVILQSTKIRIFNSNVKTVLFYGCETWRTTKAAMHKLQTFVNKCLRSILNIEWHDKVRNEELWERTGQERVEVQILRCKWGWIGHTLRKPKQNVTRQALKWNPQGKRNRGRPRTTWRRSTEQELKATGKSWSELEKLAKNRGKCRTLVLDLCASWR